MAYAVVHSKAAVLLVLIIALIGCGVLCLVLVLLFSSFSYSSFTIILIGKRENWLLYFNCLSDFFFYIKCSVTLLQDVVGWSAVCGCGIS